MPQLTDILSDRHGDFEQEEISLGDIVAHFEDRGF